jgi:hypothetical protein
MASPLSEFGQTAQRLARNPLGIIALFIVLYIPSHYIAHNRHSVLFGFSQVVT